LSQEPTPSRIVSSGDIVAEARSWLGVRWKHRGRGREGIDCVGLILKACEPFPEIHDYDDAYIYTRTATSGELEAIFARHSTRVRLGPGGLEALQDADVLIMRDTVFPQHVGLVATRGGHRTLVHASVAARRVVEENLTDEHRRLAIAAFRIRLFS
jgi:cell wall-associated NlpC family hydrolase